MDFIILILRRIAEYQNADSVKLFVGWWCKFRRACVCPQIIRESPQKQAHHRFKDIRLKLDITAAFELLEQFSGIVYRQAMNNVKLDRNLHHPIGQSYSAIRHEATMFALCRFLNHKALQFARYVNDHFRPQHLERTHHGNALFFRYRTKFYINPVFQ